MIAALKIGTLVLWLVVLANVIMPFGTVAGINLTLLLNYTGIGLAIAHFAEVLMYIPWIQKAPGSKALHCLQVFVFGVAHFMVLKQITAETDNA